jgi:hypothetical protein
VSEDISELAVDQTRSDFYDVFMEARIVRGTPSRTLQGQPLWQLETRPSSKSDWSRLYGQGHSSTLEAELRKTAQLNGWTIVPSDHP